MSISRSAVALVLTIAVTGLGARGPAIAAAADARPPAVAPDEAMEDVRILAAPAMRGREAGSAEAQLAAQLVRQRFRQLGLVPAGDADGSGTSFYQRVPLVRVTADLARSTFTVTGAAAAGEAEGAPVASGASALREPGSAMRFTHGDGAWIEVGGLPADASRDLEVVFAGWGIEAPDRGHNDYASIDVKDKAVVVWDGEPKLADGKSPFTEGRMSRHALVATKRAAAERHGARLVIVIAPPGGKPVEAAFLRDRRDKERPRLVTAGTAPSPVTVLLGPQGAARLFGGTATDQRAVTGPELEALLKQATPGNSVGRPLTGVKVRLALENLKTTQTGDPNVLALLEGADPELRSEVVVIAAHYDHIGYDRNPDGSEVVYAGADDNASGTAAVLAAARQLAAGPRPQRSVLFAVFAAEESGTLGSRWFVEHPTLGARKVVAAIDLDMVGRSNLGRADYQNVIMASFTARCALFSPVLVESALAVGLDVRKIPSLRAAGRSDDAPFAEAGIPAVLLFDGFNDDYDSPGDTPDKIEAAKLARVTQLAVSVARGFANHPGPIPWDAKLEQAPPADPWDRPY